MSKIFTFEYIEREENDLGKYPIYSNVKKEIEFNEESGAGDLWPNVLREFVDFLSSIYGYSIRDYIKLDITNNTEDFECLKKDKLDEFKVDSKVSEYINSIKGSYE